MDSCRQNLSRIGVFAVVAEVVSEAIAPDVPVNEILEESTLIGDLGAESIDFLDLIFRLEKRFGIKIPPRRLFPTITTDFISEFVQDGVVSPEGVAEIKKLIPHADLSAFEKDPRVVTLSEIYTVKYVVNYMMVALEV